MDMSKTFQQIKAFARQRSLPLIPVCSDDIQIIREPTSFYSTLLSSIISSRQKIALSALYLGTGEKERAMLQALSDKLQRDENFKVHLALDAGRATRLDSAGRSSATSIRDLLNHPNVRFDLVSIHDKRSLLSRILARFQKWNELLTTYHAKMMIFDRDVIITGANLSSNYFETRQDRYMTIKNSYLLSHYLFGLLDVVCVSAEQPATDIIEFNQAFIQKVLQADNDNNNQGIGLNDSYILPLVQHGPSALTDKEDFLKFLDSILPGNARVYISTGYFNPSETIQSLRITSVLAPSEKANGFYGGNGPLGFVPRLYSSLHKIYIDTHEDCIVNVYNRPDWSFHAKGIWVEGLNDLYVHFIGSSNYNYRSSCRDFETQLVILTRNAKLIEKLKQERECLWKESRQLRSQDVTGLNFCYDTAARLLRSIL